MDAVIIIPASSHSLRIPNKPLVDIAGESLVRRTLHRASLAKPSRLIVATDSKQVAAECEGYAEVVVTKGDHRNGTQRCAEAADVLRIDPDVTVVNWQVDEPFVDAMPVKAACELIQNPPPDPYDNDDSFLLHVSTIVGIHEDPREGIVHAAFENGLAWWFTRTAIWSARHHVGVYCFSKRDLSELAKLPQSRLGVCESLEQLDWVVIGVPIYAVDVGLYRWISVNTPEDVGRAADMIRRAR